MKSLIVSTDEIESALCANLEILIGLRALFLAHRAPAHITASLLASLGEFRAGLLGMRSRPIVPADTIETAQLSHAEITHAVQQGCEAARVPPELAAQLAAICDQFAKGLARLAASPEVETEPRVCVTSSPCPSSSGQN